MLYIKEPYFPITDYTEGVFETILIIDRKPVFFKEHLNRFETALSYMGFPRINGKKLRTFIKASLLQVDFNKGTLRIIGLKNKIVIALEKKEYEDDLYVNGVSLDISEFKKDHLDLKYQYKTVDYGKQLYALKEARKEGYFESVILNDMDQITSGAISNIFFLIDGKWFAPPISAGVLGGIVRDVLKPILQWKESSFNLSQLEKSESILISNSLLGILPVRRLKSRKVEMKKKMYSAIMEQYNNLVMESLNENW